MFEQRDPRNGSTSSQFWCHHCQQQFLSYLRPGIDEVTCPKCEGDFCEMFTSHSQPNHFEPYQKPLRPRVRQLPRITSHAVQLALAQYAEDLSAQRVREINEEDVSRFKVRVDRAVE